MLKDLAVVALDEADADVWRAEYPELADAAVIYIGPDAWRQLEHTYPATILYAPRASSNGAIAGVEKPWRVKWSLTFAEKQRPAYLRAVA